MLVRGRLVGSCLLAFVLVATSARAQGGSVFAEGGAYSHEYGNGYEKGGAMIGVGLGATIGGNSGKDFGFAVPITGELRFHSNFKNGRDGDGLVGADAAIRIFRVSFGPGFNYGRILRTRVPDPACLVAVQNGCYLQTSANFGNRDVGFLDVLGLSGFGKVTFGAQQRGFAQVRYIHYGGGAITFTPRSGNVDHYSGYPDPEGGHDVRVSAGYVFGGAGSHGKLLRVQWSQMQFDFPKTDRNITNILSQKEHMFTFGFGLAF